MTGVVFPTRWQLLLERLRNMELPRSQFWLWFCKPTGPQEAYQAKPFILFHHLLEDHAESFIEGYNSYVTHFEGLAIVIRDGFGDAEPIYYIDLDELLNVIVMKSRTRIASFICRTNPCPQYIFVLPGHGFLEGSNYADTPTLNCYECVVAYRGSRGNLMTSHNIDTLVIFLQLNTASDPGRSINILAFLTAYELWSELTSSTCIGMYFIHDLLYFMICDASQEYVVQWSSV